jgi:hypothetical protein
MLFQPVNGLVKILGGLLHPLEESFLIHEIVKKRQQPNGGDMGVWIIEDITDPFLVDLNFSTCTCKLDLQKDLIFVGHDFISPTQGVLPALYREP